MKCIENDIGEVWKKFNHPNLKDDYTIYISNYGKIKKKKYGELKLISCYLLHKYWSFGIPTKKNKTKTLYVHKEVARHFIKKTKDQSFVIHLDFVKTNNKFYNLKWASQKEVFQHHENNPVILKRKKYKIPTNSKLSAQKVKILKRKLFDPNRKTRLKILARQFGISQMQLHRIKTGENWSHVTDY
ncbi:MAG: HNH endonuclease [Flavobacteriaceae bacterium]|nr:HNH endonuclease [Flavobacteriaceae bacterium]